MCILPKIFWILKHEYFWNICKSCIILIEKACKHLTRHYCSLTALQIHNHKRQIIPVYFIYIFSEIEVRLMLRDKLFTIFLRISSKTIYLNMNMELCLFEVSIYQARLHSSLEMTTRGDSSLQAILFCNSINSITCFIYLLFRCKK